MAYCKAWTCELILALFCLLYYLSPSLGSLGGLQNVQHRIGIFAGIDHCHKTKALCGTGVRRSCKYKLIIGQFSDFKKYTLNLLYILNEITAIYSVQIRSLAAEIWAFEVCRVSIFFLIHYCSWDGLDGVGEWQGGWFGSRYGTRGFGTFVNIWSVTSMGGSIVNVSSPTPIVAIHSLVSRVAL